MRITKMIGICAVLAMTGVAAQAQTGTQGVNTIQVGKPMPTLVAAGLQRPLWIMGAYQ